MCSVSGPQGGYIREKTFSSEESVLWKQSARGISPEEAGSQGSSVLSVLRVLQLAACDGHLVFVVT
jgi:hypothetical protein